MSDLTENFPPTFQDALAHHQAGRLQRAEAIYLTMPDNPDALHLHGVIAAQTGQHALAIARITQAIQLSPGNPAYHCNLGSAFQALQHLPEAVASFRQALTLNPQFTLAHNNLGNALKSLDQLDDAVLSFQQALALKPDYVEALSNLGAVLMQQEKPDAAADCYQQALALKPDFFEAHFNLGNARKAQADPDAAIRCYRDALAIRPDSIDAHNNLGLALQAQGELDQAGECFLQALAIDANSIDARNNLGSCLNQQGKPDEAIVCFQQLLAIKPDSVAACNNLGLSYKLLGKMGQAISCFKQALTIQPDFADAHNNLGIAYKEQGRLDDALHCFQQALAIKPDFSDAHSNLLFCHNYHPTLSADEIFSAYRQWNAQQCGQISTLPCTNNPIPKRRLKIAYLSPDFRQHSVIHFAAPLIAAHDKSQFEIFCYYNHYANDTFTGRMMAAADHWIPCVNMSDAQLAQHIRDDGIDILVDLAGHTAGNRLLTFARKPAPVQVSWLGFGYTTGLTAMDYFIGDPVFTPSGCEAWFSESVLRLPDCFSTYQPPAAAPPPNDLPALRNGYVTFACLSRNERINQRVIQTWATLLRRMPQARLRLDSKTFCDEAARRTIEADFEAYGITAKQLQLGFSSPVWQVYQEVDIVLDCFPHNCGTTTYEALWMGLPVITLADRPSVGRIGASILSCLGKTEWIAADSEDYVNRALELAQDLATLAATRMKLRQLMTLSPLLDQVAFVHNMEVAYRTMWKMWCDKVNAVNEHRENQ